MRITIKGTPMAKQSAKFVRRGSFVKSYQPKKIVNWVSQARMQILQQLPEGFVPLDGDIFISELKYVFPPLKSWSKKKWAELQSGKTIFKNTKPDMDNLTKNTWDACNGVLWTDDARIVKIQNITKEYGEVPCVIMEVEDGATKYKDEKD